MSDEQTDDLRVWREWDDLPFEAQQEMTARGVIAIEGHEFRKVDDFWEGAKEAREEKEKKPEEGVIPIKEWTCRAVFARIAHLAIWIRIYSEKNKKIPKGG